MRCSFAMCSEEVDRSVSPRATAWLGARQLHRRLHTCAAVGVPSAGGRSEHGAALRSRTSGAVIPRREFGPRDPCAPNQQRRCMPRSQATGSALVAAAAAGHETETDFPPCSLARRSAVAKAAPERG
jgi:hypothetical protein